MASKRTSEASRLQPRASAATPSSPTPRQWLQSSDSSSGHSDAMAARPASPTEQSVNSSSRRRGVWRSSSARLRACRRVDV
eukprot:364525-Chlamydomonas_euryale.AAC.4